MLIPDRILPIFRDAEAVVLDLIEAYFATSEYRVKVGDQTPADEDLQDAMPFVRVGRVGGAPIRGSEHTDRPVIDVDVFASTRRDARRLAALIEQLMLSAPHPLDEVNVLMSPQRLSWVDGIPVVRFYGSYQCSLRR